MNASTMLQDIEKYIPVVGDVNFKSVFAYKATREVVGVVNKAQMAVAEAYINGLEVTDSVLRSLFDTCMPIFFQYFPALLTPYEWVLKETDNLAGRIWRFYLIWFVSNFASCDGQYNGNGQYLMVHS